MKLANVKALAVKLSISSIAAGALLFACTAPANAQQWGVAVQYGQPAYAVGHNDSYRAQERREILARERTRREFLERQRHEELLRRRAFLRYHQAERGHADYDRSSGSYR